MIADIVAKTMKQRMSPAGPAAAAGRNGDQILAHISPKEADLLKRLGGSGTINPETGIMEFWGDWGADFGPSPSDYTGSSLSDALGGNSYGGFGLDGVSGGGSTSGATSGGGAGFSGGGNSYNGGGYSGGSVSGSSYADAMGPTEAGGFGLGGVEGSGGTANGGSTSGSYGEGGTSTGSTSTGGFNAGGFDVPGNTGFGGFGTAIGDSSIGGISTGGLDTSAGDPALSGAPAGGVSAGTPTEAGAAATTDTPAAPEQAAPFSLNGWSPFGMMTENVMSGRPQGIAFGMGQYGIGTVPQSGALLSTTLDDGPVYGLPESLNPAASLRGMAADLTGRHPGVPGDDGSAAQSVTVGGAPAGPSTAGSVTTDRGPLSSFGFGAGMSRAQGRGYSNPQGPGPGAWGSSGQFAATVPGTTTMAKEFPAGTPIADAAARAYQAFPDMPKGYLEAMYGVESLYGTLPDRPGSRFQGPLQQSFDNMRDWGLPGSRDPKNPYDAMMAAGREFMGASAKAGRTLSPVEGYTAHQQGVYGMAPAFQDLQAPIKDYLSASNIRANNRDPNMTVQQFIDSWQSPYFDPRSDYRNPVGTVPGIDSSFFR